ncbi:MAG: NAD-dependent epimerase/dehydratase family protein [Luteitalea sp.]|nr:NAD-dependent epimerase/dehydratase family protein [Luteitalea sp.]
MRAVVTGANGHVGNNLCRALVERGYTVRAGVRSLADPKKTRHLAAMDGLELVEADLYRPDQLRAACDGTDILFHVAAVYAYVVGEREADDMVRASVEGAENALRAAAETKVRKVVLTSSIVTLPLTAPGAPPSTEDDWTTDPLVPYFRAKTLAEKRAWELAKELRLTLVTVLPGAIGGPGFAHNTPTIDAIEGIMLGTMRLGAPRANLPYVDIRDVISAHVLAAEADCRGRFIVCNDRFPSFIEIIETMHGIDPKVRRALMTLPDFMLPAAPFFDRLNHRRVGSPRVLVPELIATLRGKIWNASNERAKRELGWRQEIPLEASLRDTMNVLKRRRASKAASLAQSSHVHSRE